MRKHAQLLGYKAPQKSFEPLQITLETKATTTKRKRTTKKLITKVVSFEEKFSYICSNSFYVDLKLKFEIIN